MSKHLPYRLNLTYKAIFAATLGLSTLSAFALTLGQPNVTSVQHEPLSATIDVSGVDANNFNASLANASIYQQMGLNQSDNIQVTFIKTSDTSGRIVLTSNAPISTPFADIVLNLNDNGEQRIEPQTLLMPLSQRSRIEMTADEMPIVAQNQSVDLPVVDVIELEPTSEALEVQSVAPPPLFDDEEQNSDTSTINTTTQETPANKARVIDEQTRVISSITPEGTNTQLNILTEQIVRRIVSPEELAAKNTTDSTTELSEPPLDTTPANTEQSQGTGTYVVQSGDNLWNIANQIAKANNMSVNEVMTALHKQNPQAFHNGKINQLRANSTLVIPNYRVVPSQKAIQEAISTRKHTSSETRAGTNTRTSTKPQRSTRVTNQPLPRPQMTLVAPSQNGQGSGSSQSKGTTSGNGGNELVGTLRATRAQTAQNARRVNGLNQELSSATQKLQLQNQKLAELEARLKALREQ